MIGVSSLGLNRLKGVNAGVQLRTGKIGNDSAAARFAAATAQSGFKIEESRPYSEVPILLLPLKAALLIILSSGWEPTHPTHPRM